MTTGNNSTCCPGCEAPVVCAPGCRVQRYGGALAGEGAPAPRTRKSTPTRASFFPSGGRRRAVVSRAGDVETLECGHTFTVTVRHKANEPKRWGRECPAQDETNAVQEVAA